MTQTNSPRGRVVKVLACQSEDRWIGSHTSPIIFLFLHIENAYRNCKSLDFKAIQFDTVDSIEILMYRPNLSPVVYVELLSSSLQV